MEERQSIKEAIKDLQIEIIDFYETPSDKPQQKNSVQKGNCHLYIGKWGLELRNIPYRMQKGKVQVKTPGVSLFKEKGDLAFVPTFRFHRPRIWKAIRAKIKQELLILDYLEKQEKKKRGDTLNP